VKADLTRISYDPVKGFSRVLMQQGRVQLDADWNEQASILLHLIRRLAADLGGQAWTTNGGFIPLALTDGPVTDDVAFAVGDVYVDGILVENQATPVAVTLQPNSPNVLGLFRWTVDDTSFAVGQYLQLFDPTQPGTTVICKITAVDYAASQVTVDTTQGIPAGDANVQAARLVTYKTQPYLVPPPLFAAQGPVELYIDLWERLITSVEDDSIPEIALGGPDTAARTKVVWQIKTIPAPAQTPDANAVASVTAAQLAQKFQPANRGLLRARVQPGAASTDPCAVSPTSSYRGVENQLYRVEIHDGGAIGAGPSFSWSRENGAVVFPLSAAAIPGTGTVTAPLSSLGRDDRFGLAERDWVELQDDALALSSAAAMTRAPALLQVQSINRGMMQVTLTGAAPSSAFGSQPGLHPLLRRWDQQDGDPAAGGVALTKGGAVPIPSAAGQWIDLEDGVQVLFEAQATATYRTGDYWLIPARVATGDVIWPQETDDKGQLQPVARPPDGVDHHYAPLAVLTAQANAVPTIQGLLEQDAVRLTQLTTSSPGLTGRAAVPSSPGSTAQSAAPPVKRTGRRKGK
jgi:Family of unknown function (DUF6519)